MHSHISFKDLALYDSAEEFTFRDANGNFLAKVRFEKERTKDGGETTIETVVRVYSWSALGLTWTLIKSRRYRYDAPVSGVNEARAEASVALFESSVSSV